MHAYMNTYIHTHIYTYSHTHMCIYINIHHTHIKKLKGIAVYKLTVLGVFT